MRHLLCVALFSCILGFGSLTAGDLSTAQAQQLVSAAQSAQPGGKPIEAILSIDGKNVVFTIVRDSVGNVIARPVPGPDSAGITISQVSIQVKTDATGALVPTSMVVVSSNQTIVSYSIQLNPDGTVASLYQAGSFGGAAGNGAAAPPVVGGIGDGKTVAKNDSVSASDLNAAGQTYGFPSGQLPLPAGAGTSEISHSLP